MTTKDALILGGAGFIGTHLARQLIETQKFRKIVSLDVVRPQRPVKGVMYYNHDVRTPLHAAVDSHFDYVFNLAAVHRTPGHPDTAYYDTNVAGATNAVAYCERHDIENLFFTSSISVYGPSESAVEESSLLSPNGAYGSSKKLAEDIHCAWFERAPDRRLRIVRPAVVFGEGENGNFSLLARLLRSGVFIYPGRRDTLKSSGYVKELVRTMLFALNRPEPFYLYNFADRRVPTIEDICRSFARLGLPVPLGTAPRAVVEAGGSACEILNACGLRNPINRMRIHKLLYSTNVRPAKLLKDNYPFAFDLDSAISDWLANDQEVRPAARALSARPIVPPAIDLDIPSGLRPAASMRASAG